LKMILQILPFLTGSARNTVGIVAGHALAHWIGRTGPQASRSYSKGGPH
jgi:uncharacterized membrane protein YdjX (TVP38/TMEM64 family)